MSDADIDKAVKEAAAFEAQDKKRKEGVDAKNEAESMLFQVENAMNEAGDKLEAGDKADVQADLDALKAVVEKYKNNNNLGDSEIAEVKAAKDKLMNSAQKLFAKMYEQTQQAGQGPQGGAYNGGSQGGDDDVVDADYTEV
jgi:molecular chaperone DnaK